MPERTCDRCGRPNDRPRAANCRRCSKSIENAKHRGTTAPPPLAEFDCDWCGKHCIRGVNVVAHASRFCSKGHKAAWHKKYVERRTANVSLGPTCRLRRQQERRWISGPCPECGAVVTRLAGRGHGYCSSACRFRQKRRRRRARTAGAGNKTLSFRSVAERDGWTCQLCGGTVNPTLTVPHPMAATLDHVIPLSMGGEHSEANGQLAHFLCNSRKGDGASATATGDQLAML